MSAKTPPPPKDAPFAAKLAYYAEGPVGVRLCAQMKYYNRECRGHLVDRYCPTLRGHMFVSGPCKDWHDPDRARRAGQKMLARMRRQLVDIALEEALTKAFNEPLTDDDLSIVVPFPKAQMYDGNPAGFVESARAALSAVSDQTLNDRGYNPKPNDQPRPIITPSPPRPTAPERAGRSNS